MTIIFDFFDNLPKSWETARVKNILDYNHHYPIGDGDHGSIKPEMYQDDGVPYLRVQNLSWGFDINYDNLVYISDEVNLANSKSILIPKDILIAKTGATVGKMAIIPESMKQANTTSSVGKITINHKLFNHIYFAYLFSSPMFQEQIKEKAYQKSAQPGFNIDDLIEFNIIIPPLDDQNKIADYLDKKIAKIDATISKNGELIQLLEEKRVALIKQVVTKGLNHNVPMKDSRIDWIGNIPKNWNIERLGPHCYITTGHPFNSDLFATEGIPLIRIRDLKEGHTTLFWNNEYPNYAVVNYGDLLVGMDGDFDVVSWKGSTALLNQRIFKIVAQNKLSNTYLKYILQPPLTHINELTMSTTVKHLSIKDVNDILIPLPPYDEQKEISDYLDGETSKIDRTLSKIQNNISLLNEYKNSLIHHVVTGKIDVRGEEI